jgi:hypothetical protein
LDTDGYFNFQFNPDVFEWSQEFFWAHINWKGAIGGDHQYLSSGPRQFRLALLFVADPGAPRIEDYNTQSRISTPDLAVDYEALIDTVDAWMMPLSDKRRPSRLHVIFSRGRYFDVIVRRVSHQITEFFPDLRPREATLTLECVEWLLRPAEKSAMTIYV